jgi:polysaccharide export outer membrane protein
VRGAVGGPVPLEAPLRPEQIGDPSGVVQAVYAAAPGQGPTAAPPDQGGCAAVPDNAPDTVPHEDNHASMPDHGAHASVPDNGAYAAPPDQGSYAAVPDNAPPAAPDKDEAADPAPDKGEAADPAAQSRSPSPFPPEGAEGRVSGPQTGPPDASVSLGPRSTCGPSSAPPGGPDSPDAVPADRPLPTELAKVSHPPYMIEPPDILLIDAVRLVPRAPYTVRPLDALLIQISGIREGYPAVNGVYPVSPDGTVNLGSSYGAVRVAGMTLDMVQDAVTRQLSRSLKGIQVSVALTQFCSMQQLRGEHLVRQDGTISLGSYGCVYVTGMTIAQAKAAIEQFLSQFLQDPEISLDVFAYNSKVYYIIIDGAGFGQQVYRLPITGNETVLDAISAIQGLPPVASKRRIWVARPTPAHHGCTQILPVDWLAIVEGGSTETNYQLFPGDRIYVKADCLIHLDNAIAKIVSPVERLFGVTLLAETTIHPFRHDNHGTAFIVP